MFDIIRKSASLAFTSQLSCSWIWGKKKCVPGRSLGNQRKSSAKGFRLGCTDLEEQSCFSTSSLPCLPAPPAESPYPGRQQGTQWSQIRPGPGPVFPSHPCRAGMPVPFQESCRLCPLSPLCFGEQRHPHLLNSLPGQVASQVHAEC